MLQCDRVIELYRCEIEATKKLKRAYFEILFPKQGSRNPEIRFSGYNIPWKQCRLKDVTQKIGSGKTPLGGKKVYQAVGIPLIRSQNVINDQVDLTDVVYIDAATNEEMENSSVRYGDVLLNITGASIGRSAVYKGKTDANVNQHVCIIRPNNVVSSEFIQLHLSSYNGQKQINLSQTGGGRQGLNFEQIGEMKFLFPSEDEQKCIGEFFEYFNHFIALLLHKLGEMQRTKKALMQLLLTGVVRVST